MVTRVDLASVRALKVIVRDCVTNRPGGDGQARKQEDQSGSARRRSDRHPVTVALLLRNWKKGPTGPSGLISPKFVTGAKSARQPASPKKLQGPHLTRLATVKAILR